MLKQFLKRLLQGEPVEKTSNLLILIDLKKHTRGGHFGPWLRWFGLEFSSRFNRTAIATPDPELTRSLFQDVKFDENKSLTFHKLPRRLRKVYDLNYLAKKLAKSSETVHFFLMWGFDLVELKIKLTHKLYFKWATLFSISKLHRQPDKNKSNTESNLLSIVESDSNCKGFFHPDMYIKNPSRKAIWIPDIESIETLNSSTNLINDIKHFKSDRITIGAFGILTGERCVNELIKLVRCQSDVKFVLVGKIVHKTVLPNLQKYLTEEIPNNLFIYPYFLEKEKELNSIIKIVDGVFIDGTNYQQHSGIVCKALYFGKGILSPIGNSWTNDVISENGVGLSYDDPKFNLQLEWTKWIDNNGKSRSTATSAKIRSPLAIKRSFDLITKNLLN